VFYPPKKFADMPGLNNIKQDKKEIPPSANCFALVVKSMCLAKTSFVSEIVHILGLKLNPFVQLPVRFRRKIITCNKKKRKSASIQSKSQLVSRYVSKYSKFPKLEFKLQTSIVII